MMRGFKLNSDHDLELVNGSPTTVDGIEAVGQEIKTRLLFFKGENFLDTREGVPYFTELLAKGVQEVRVRSMLRQAILNVPGIVDVPEVKVEINRATREASITFSARYQATGDVIDFPPLVIDL